VHESPRRLSSSGFEPSGFFFSTLSAHAGTRRTQKPKNVPKIAFYIGLNKSYPVCSRNRTKFPYRPDTLRRIGPTAGFSPPDKTVIASRSVEFRTEIRRDTNPPRAPTTRPASYAHLPTRSSATVPQQIGRRKSRTTPRASSVNTCRKFLRSRTVPQPRPPRIARSTAPHDRTHSPASTR